MWLEFMDVVVRRYINFHITYTLVSTLFGSSIPTFCSFFMLFALVYSYIYIPEKCTSQLN